MIHCKENLTIQYVSKCTNAIRRKLRDFLDRNCLECSKGSGDSISSRLLLLLDTLCSSSSSFVNNLSHLSAQTSTTNSKVGKRDFLKSPCNKEDLYSGPYGDVILSAVKEKCLQDFAAFEMLEEHQLDILHVMFNDEAPRYFIDIVKETAQNTSDAFERSEKHFLNTQSL